MKRKLTNVILPYLIMSLPAIILFTCFAHRHAVPASFYEHPIPIQILLFYLTGGHLTTYWFIPMISVYYLLSPVLIWGDRKSWLYYALPGLVLASLCVPRGSLPMNLVHFLSVYVLGMFFSRYRERILIVIGYVWPALLTLAIACIVVEFEWTLESPPLNLVQKLLLCAFLVGVFSRYERLNSRMLAFCAETSFGMYFVHPYVIGLIKLATGTGDVGTALLKSDNSAWTEGNLAAYCACLIAVVALSAGIVEAARRTLGRYSRMIVGS